MKRKIFFKALLTSTIIILLIIVAWFLIIFDLKKSFNYLTSENSFSVIYRLLVCVFLYLYTLYKYNSLLKKEILKKSINNIEINHFQDIEDRFGNIEKDTKFILHDTIHPDIKLIEKIN